MMWISREENEARQKALDDFWKAVLWGAPKREPKEDDNVKLAYVYIGECRAIIGVDNKTMQGYELRQDAPTWKLPLKPQSYDRFERWCTTFDV